MLLNNVETLNYINNDKLINDISLISKTEYKTIGELCELKLGKQFPTSYFNKGLEELYPVYSSATQNEGVIGMIDTYDYDGEYVTWTTRGMAGEVFYRNGKFSISSNCGILKIRNKNDISYKFLYYILKIKMPNPTSSLIPMMNLNHVEQIQIPIPPIEIQNTIVNLLDKLQEYSINIQGLLPQEAQLCEEQYQYYLNRLLDFSRERER